MYERGLLSAASSTHSIEIFQMNFIHFLYAEEKKSVDGPLFCEDCRMDEWMKHVPPKRRLTFNGLEFYHLATCSSETSADFQRTRVLPSCDMFLRNMGLLRTDYTAVYPSR
jgi:hypothetical protein